jgi:hypothetical protein
MHEEKEKKIKGTRKEKKKRKEKHREIIMKPINIFPVS